MKRFLCYLCCITVRASLCDNTSNYTFPSNFMIGVANSAYQSEGAWNEDGKGVNIWDTFVHRHPDLILDGSTGDVADDSYHLYKQDVLLLKELGVDFYRFSISWSRILPTGHVHHVNQKGVDYYNRVIDELIASGITPVVTMYHWDLPQQLQDLGGWPNPVIAEYFENYAYVLFSNFGDRVKWWITINEPSSVSFGYRFATKFAPAMNTSTVGYYLSAYTLIQAHARAYRLYDSHFRNTQNGKVGFTLFSTWFEPATDSIEDVEAAERALQFLLGLFANPIYSSKGDYPTVVKENVDRISKLEGYRRSRLRMFTPEEISNIRGTYDFFGMNFYSTYLVKNTKRKPGHHFIPDVQARIFFDPKWPPTASSLLKVVPWGFRKVLNWVKHKYNNTPVLVTENGYSDHGQIHDTDRIHFIVDHMKEMLKAVNEDGCDVIGYSYWTLFDNFEWNSGYIEKYGLFYVNFSDAQLRRVPKSSAHVFKEIVCNRKLPNMQQTHEVMSNLTVKDTVITFNNSKTSDGSSASSKGMFLSYSSIILLLCLVILVSQHTLYSIMQ